MFILAAVGKHIPSIMAVLSTFARKEEIFRKYSQKNIRDKVINK